MSSFALTRKLNRGRVCLSSVHSALQNLPGKVSSNKKYLKTFYYAFSSEKQINKVLNFPVSQNTEGGRAGRRIHHFSNLIFQLRTLTQTGTTWQVMVGKNHSKGIRDTLLHQGNLKTKLTVVPQAAEFMGPKKPSSCSYHNWFSKIGYLPLI